MQNIIYGCRYPILYCADTRQMQNIIYGCRYPILYCADTRQMQNTLCERLRWLRIDFNIIDDKICLERLKSLYGASGRVYEGVHKILQNKSAGTE